MFSRSKPELGFKPLKRGAPGLSFIGPEAVVSGDLNSDAHLHIDGRIDGHVRCVAFCQGRTGTVTGNIRVEDARIAGLVEGAVFATSLILESTARIKGDITYQTISIAAGAQVDGRLTRSEAVEIELLKEVAAPMLTATPIVEPKAELAESVSVPKPPRKSERADKMNKAEPALSDDIFTLTPPSQAGAH